MIYQQIANTMLIIWLCCYLGRHLVIREESPKHVKSGDMCRAPWNSRSAAGGYKSGCAKI